MQATTNWFKSLPLFVLALAALNRQSLAAEPTASGALQQQQKRQEAAWVARGCFDDARGQWFREAKFGAFIHFGPYSQLGGHWQGKAYRPAEQIIGLGQKQAVIPRDQYREAVAGQFNPTNFDAQQWVSLIKAAGQKYVIVTTKHHDGFCMFRTATTSNNIVDATPFGRDVIKELADECKKQGLVFCPYYSIGDWSAAGLPDNHFGTYKEYMFAQLKELLTNYGDIRMLWFDNYWYVDNQWKNDLAHARELYAYARSFSPTLLINDRCGRGANSTDGDYATPENQLVGSRQSRYFEVVMTDTDDDNWGWVRGATNYRGANEVIRNLIDSTSKGGNFVLNVGPTATGEFPVEHVALLKTVGQWTSVNGRAIYGTTPAPECVAGAATDFQWYATKKANHIYLHVLKWPAAGKRATVQINRMGLKQAALLDSTLPPVRSVITGAGPATVLELAAPTKVDPYATVVELTFGE